MTLRTALDQGTRILENAGVGAPRLTAEVLLAHALQRDRTWLYTHDKDELTELGWIHFGRYLHQRKNGVPTQYITGRQEFYGRVFRVNNNVLIPRPETEGLVEEALRVVNPASVVVDVGTGSGAIAVTLSLEQPRATVVALDISADALLVAKRNARQLQAGCSFLRGDLLSALASRSVDVVVSNPPYVSREESAGLQREVVNYEPHVALFADESGKAAYRKIIHDAQRVLRPGGHLLLELGWRSAEPVRAMLNGAWAEAEVVPDLVGIPRVLRTRLRP